MPTVDKEMVCPGCGASILKESTDCEYCGRRIVLTSLNVKQVRKAAYQDSARFLDLYKDALKKSPDNPQVLASLGYTLFDRGEYGEAINKFEQASAQGFEDADVTFHIALARLKSKKPFQIKLKEAEQIVQMIDNAIAINPLPQYYCAKSRIIRKLFEQRFVKYAWTSDEVMAEAEAAGLSESDITDIDALINE
ncbi:hypothetical protein KIMH_03170 [Bombiscardovia apis]|uniref:Tetratricopeptide repeat protein n=1 Tax=Bombiscardovia apis TaxID=2932182 RepID=A0ABN6SDU0_9BIFI|nr:tetratricopeptide repeat protein [Bombiscardovia apis]BDR54206.1 hypothetical protein KIMH_03170 [Bombiscardovia apis]